uniref:ras GTPase-activating-like protein IQGAP1 n=1 Tax=Myxine glutinosa TaxID=7769 RepID=UPI00358EC297
MSQSDEIDGLARPYYGSIRDDERLTAEQMDMRRKQNVAYEYLCHLQEAKQWIEVCLKEELPPTTELEEGLRNGVYLAKLGHFCSPQCVPLKKIYDREQNRYKAMGLHFRHTDNINHWFKAMIEVGLPKIFYPETTDIYDRKNMPKVIYCIHALSLYLFKLGRATQMQNLFGKVTFTEEEITNMRKELDKYGIQMPTFSKIGGILTNELSVDEAALHAAVIVINDAVEKGEAEETLMALCNPNAMLLQVNRALIQMYQDILQQAKREKVENARNRPLLEAIAEEERDVYEELLTQAEIQGNINQVNQRAALNNVEKALCESDEDLLLEILQSPALALLNIHRANGPWYLQELSKRHREKAESLGKDETLSKEELQDGVETANAQAHRENMKVEAVVKINAALRAGIEEETLLALQQPEALLPPVLPFTASLYQRELRSVQEIKGDLSHEELSVKLKSLSTRALMNQALESHDAVAVLALLAENSHNLQGLDNTNLDRYVEALITLKSQATSDEHECLSWDTIQTCIQSVNTTVQKENDRVNAIELINEALEHGELAGTLEALLLPAADMTGIRPTLAQHYQDVLLLAKQRKAKDTADESAVLWLEEIQDGIDRANQDDGNALKMAAGVSAVDAAVVLEDADMTLVALRSSALALRGVTPECTDVYQYELADARTEKITNGCTEAVWVRHRMRDGFDFYYQAASQEGTWEKPTEFTPKYCQLSREEIQAVVGRVTAAYNREQLWTAHERVVLLLQAHGRGFVVRRELANRKAFLERQEPAIIKLQAHWRGFYQKRIYRNRVAFLHSNVPSIIKIQALVRMYLAKRRYRARLKYFTDHINCIVKIQAFLRANKAREDYRTLISSAMPPLSVVRKFAHLLQQSGGDFAEEVEVMRLREEVMTKIHSNQQLEQDLNVMDIKIGLLVKNRITVQDVVMHSKKLNKKNKEQVQDMMTLDKQKGLKSLSKEKRTKLEAYQHLFYLLQTNPTYLAKLIFQMPQKKSMDSMDTMIYTLYNYASNQREEYLILKLFCTALQEEIKSKVDELQEIVKGNPTVVKMVVKFHRMVRGQNALREILSPLVDIVQDKSLIINIDPVDIYKIWVNHMESKSGEASNLPYDVTAEGALAHEEVRKRLETAEQNLFSNTDKLLSSIISSVDQIPYGMRYVAKVLRDSLHDKFPNSTEDEIYKIVGNLLYYRYMNPVLVAPDSFGVLDLAAGEQLHFEQRRNLGSLAKLLQLGATGKMLPESQARASSLNNYIGQLWVKFRKFFQAACDVPEMEEKFTIDEYSDIITLSKPIVFISIGEIINTHSLLLEHQEAIAPDHNDPLIELLEDLGDVPSLQTLVGDVPGQEGDGNKDNMLESLAKTQISLSLTNKFDVAGGTNADTSRLLTKMKKLVADIIQVQPGETLLNILKTPASAEQEKEYQHLMMQRAALAQCAPEKMRHSVVNEGITLADKKQQVFESLPALEDAALVSQSDSYQTFINDIAKDIRNQRRYRQRRKAELVKLQLTLLALNSKMKFYEEQSDYYDKYIKTCMDNLARKGKSTRKGKTDGKEEKGARKEKRTTVHYTAARLHEKGILLSIDDATTNELKNVLFDIMPGENPGDFEVKAKFMGIEMEKVQLNFQDLLQLQYEGVAVMKMFDKAKVNVNLLIFLLNKKFYGR